jgi:hypothetical protein
MSGITVLNKGHGAVVLPAGQFVSSPSVGDISTEREVGRVLTVPAPHKAEHFVFV